jgi:hypothetical protein
LDGKYQHVFDAKIHIDMLDRLVNQSNSFTGRTAKSDRAVMRALVQIADSLGAYTVRPGVRKISEYCGHDPRTVCSAIRRLENLRWLEVIWSGHSYLGMSQRIRLNWERAANHHTDVEPYSHLLRDLTIWTGDCLGSNARVVYKTLLLADKPLKKTPIQNATGFSYKATSTALGVLLGANLVIKDKRVYGPAPLPIYMEQDLLRKIREEWNVDEKVENRLDRHHFQRRNLKWLQKNSRPFRMLRGIAFQMEQSKKLNR